MYFIEFILLGNFNVQFSSLVKVNNKQTNKPNVTFSFEKKEKEINKHKFNDY